MSEQHTDSDREAQRLLRRRRRRRLYRLRQRVIELCILAVLVVGVVILVRSLLPDRQPADISPADESVPSGSESNETEEKTPYPVITADTVQLGDTVNAEYAVLLDVTDNRVVAAKGADTVAYPASVTKVLTLLVAAEHITDYTETYEMSYTFLNDLYLQQATVAGFSSGERVNMTDLLYGCILPSGADATIALANHLAGSEEAFAGMLNAKAAELGLKNTHFVNSSGLHDRDHYTTALDMAMVLAAAMENETCRRVLSTYQYTTAATPQHPEGLLLTSTMFSRMYGDEPEGAVIVAGKTGYTAQAGTTMASYAQGDDGHDYIFVSMKGSDKWKATYDAINIYTAFCGPDGVEESAIPQ